MNKPDFNRQSWYCHILILAALFFTGFQSAAKQTVSIILKDEQVPITPKEFYVANVIDERDSRNAVAWLIPAIKKENQPETYPIDLYGGGLVAIKQFINRNLVCNNALRPVVIGLREFMVTESALGGGLVEGHVSVVMSFGLEQGDDELMHLLDYKGSATYTRNAGPPQDIEPTIRHTLVNGLIYLNTWINRQAGTNIKLAKSVQVTFTDYEEKTEGDSVYYSVNRPITLDDFKAKIPVSKFDAEVFPGIGYDEHTEIVNGIIHVNLAMKVYLPKSASWVKDGSRNGYTLNHEQRHFDIVKIVAGHFKQKINAENLTVSNYEGIINFEYLETYREMDKLQKQYDDETRHGDDLSAQQRWNERIDKELSLVISH